MTSSSYRQILHFIMSCHPIFFTVASSTHFPSLARKRKIRTSIHHQKMHDSDSDSESTPSRFSQLSMSNSKNFSCFIVRPIPIKRPSTVEDFTDRPGKVAREICCGISPPELGRFDRFGKEANLKYCDIDKFVVIPCMAEEFSFAKSPSSSITTIGSSSALKECDNFPPVNFGEMSSTFDPFGKEIQSSIVFSPDIIDSAKKFVKSSIAARKASIGFK